MPSQHALNVSLTEHLCAFVDEQVASGRFRTASEVVRTALRLLEQDQFRNGGHDPKRNGREHDGTTADLREAP